MDKIIWKYVKELKNKQVVSEFLKQHNVNLPQELEECITINNGGRPSIFLFDTDKAKEYVFQSLFSYNEDDRNTIYPIYESLFSDSPMYPIGIDAAGNVICYDLDEKKYVLWNHENDKYENIIF